MTDTLDQQLKSIPFFRALLRAVEARFYEGLELPSPSLDLGCGDGHFASLAFETPPEIGLDPWLGPVKEAAQQQVYKMVVAGQGASLPFPEEFFSSAISNSVLEHIPEVTAVLADLHRVLKRGASFIFCVPNQRFTETLSMGIFFDNLGFGSLGDRYRRFFNRISRHHHCDSPELWKRRLEEVGFRIEKHWNYFSPASLRVLEWGHYFGLPSWVCRKLFGRWILVSEDWNLSLTKSILKPYYQASPCRDDGVYSFFITRKVS